jgi:hypothetical protein
MLRLTEEDADALCIVSNGELSNYRLTLTPVKLQSVDEVNSVGIGSDTD